MTESIFEPAGPDLYLPTEAALGPWTEQAMHGGPPAMLLAREIERFPTDAPMFVARVTVELLRPVGRTPLAVRSRLVRPGRKVRIVEASLWRDQDEVARATALFIRRAPVDVPERPDRPSLPLPDPTTVWSGVYRSAPAYHALGVEIRAPQGVPNERPPGRAWIRLRLPLVLGEEPSQLVRAFAAADFANGISFLVDPRVVTFINPDLTVYLHRLPAGEWVMIDAQTWLQPDGTGVAEGALYDERGRMGRSLQALLVEPRA